VVARDIQQHVIATLRDTVGLQTVVVNVTINDILTSEDDQLADPGDSRPSGQSPAAAFQRTRGGLPS
jgi:uncharacterized alkaline shock family protein YloU